MLSVRQKIRSVLDLFVNPERGTIFYSGLISAFLTLSLVFAIVRSRQILTTSVSEHANQILIMSVQRQVVLTAQARNFLEALSGVPAVTGTDFDDCSVYMASLLEKTGNYLNFGVLDEKGVAICSALPFTAPVDGKDRLYFRRTMESKAFSMGEYQVGRITQKQSINFGYPLMSKEGEFRGVLFAAMGLGWFEDYARSLEMPENWIFMVTDHKGVVLARFPIEEAAIGKAGLDAKLLSLVLSGTNDSKIVKGSDGVERLYVYKSLVEETGGGTYVVIAAPLNKLWGEVIGIIIITGAIQFILFGVCIWQIHKKPKNGLVV